MEATLDPSRVSGQKEFLKSTSIKTSTLNSLDKREGSIYFKISTTIYYKENNKIKITKISTEEMIN